MAEYEFLNAGNSEAQEKGALSWLFKRWSGLAATGVLGGLTVAQAPTANGTVLIAVGSCVVHPTMTAGASLLVNDTQKTLDVFTANPMGGLPRNDIVGFDSLTALISVRVGAPNATPTDPTVPNTSLALARLRHAASATTIPTAKIDDLIVATTLRGTPVQASGLINITIAVAGTPVTDAVTFPVGLFTADPIVVCTVVNTSVPQSRAAGPSAITPTGMTVYGYSASTGTVTVHWHAMQSA